MQISVYSMKFCPNCKILKQLLERENIQYKEINMATPEAMTELRINSIFTMSAPVLQIGNKFYTTKELCKQDIIDQDKVIELLKENI
jgi:glutaredoxin